MQVFESLDLPVKFPNPVLTIGNYDGVHVGHRTIIEITKGKAREMGGTSMLMTFHPHPLHVLRPDKELPSITPLEEKKRLIEEAGVEVLLIVPFTEEFSHFTPEDYVKDILVRRLDIKGLVVGYDFRFGRGGRGDIEGMKKYAEAYGFFVEVVSAVTIGGEKVGSNKIRRLLQSGDIDRANLLLGRPYMVSGKVIRGEGRGRAFGFPTINLKTDFDLVPPNGVYISQVVIGNQTLQSATNIGCNPTFGGQERTIETFIFDYGGELYGKDVRLFFHVKLREEVRFESVSELRQQIERDVIAAREYFARRTA
ncbi:MAG TPA: bifunctional riboflavin kinase/FAD synthetase [Syntrophorhabdales bacterium]|nr:bifunctional riboflavin kinase/FAD synthetase [Syntrophorhabdales bacterium]